MIETYQMRLARQAREQEELKRRNRIIRGYGNDFTIADAMDTSYTPPSYSHSSCSSDSSSSSSDSGSCSSSD